MTVFRIDRDAHSTHAAAKGFRALCEGDTVLARQKYTEAGEILERGSKADVPAADEHLLRFLAASQYYHGGEYQRAKAVAAKVNAGHLRPGHRELLSQFHEDVNERADAGYAKRVQKAVFDAWTTGRWDVAIKLLQDHPYAVERSLMAWTRSDLCYMQGQLKAAALFSADAVRFAHCGPTAVYLRAAGALRFYEPARDRAANEYTNLLLTHNPTALDYVTACVFRFERLKGGDRVSGEELLRLFDQALTAFDKLPVVTKADAAVRGYMAHGYLLASLTLSAFGEARRAEQFAETGVQLGPFPQFAHVYRAVLDQPGVGYDRWAKELSVASLSSLENQNGRRTQFESAFLSAA
jgi:hypothetical protein